MAVPTDTIADKLEAIRASLSPGVRLVAVSKFHPAEVIVEAYEGGQRLFAESRVQELMAKHDVLSTIYLDLQWHFIGPLQTNKVKYIAPFVHMIESVDSLRLLKEINRQALKHQRKIPILIEVHIAQEESKTGFEPEEVLDLIEHIYHSAKDFAGIELRGLMAMASNTDDEAQIAQEFARVHALFEQIKTSGLLHAPDDFDELSMGMSGDYHIAMQHGATLVRVGSAIFGHREEQ